MIVTIDPGTSNTALVFMTREKVIAAETIKYPVSIGNDNYQLCDCVMYVSDHVIDSIAQCAYAVDVIIMEGFVGGWSKRNNASSYTTPWLCGGLHERLRAAFPKIPLEIQTSKQVLNPVTKGNCAWVKEACKSGNHPLPGAEKCGNDHTRSALAHGIWFYQQLHNSEVE